MDLDPASWGGLEMGLKIGPVKTSTRRLRQRWAAWSGHAPPGPPDVPRGAGLGAGLPGIVPAAGR